MNTRTTQMQPPSVHSSRRGFSTVEFLVSGILVGVIGTLAVPAVILLDRVQQASRMELAARAELENLLEQVTSLEDPELSAERVEALAIELGTADQFPDAVLTASVEPEPGPPVSERITVQLQWPDGNPFALTRTRLVGWRFAKESAE